MLSKRVVREIMEKKGIGTSAMAKALGRPMRLVSDRLSVDKSENLSVDKLDEFLEVLGYKIVVIPKEEEIKDGWYEVTGSQYNGVEGQEK